MGFFKWMKRDSDVNGEHRRRQSEPPLPSSRINGRHSRDDGYLKALIKFVEWREQHPIRDLRIGKLKKYGKNSPEGNKNKSKQKQNAHQGDLSKISEQIYEQIRENPSLFRKNSSCIETQITEQYYKFSESENFSTESEKIRNIYINDSEYMKNTNNSFYANNSLANTAGVSNSPPAQFYRENFNPFQNYSSPPKLYRKTKDITSYNKRRQESRLTANTEADENYNVSNNKAKSTVNKSLVEESLASYQSQHTHDNSNILKQKENTENDQYELPKENTALPQCAQDCLLDLHNNFQFSDKTSSQYCSLPPQEKVVITDLDEFGYDPVEPNKEINETENKNVTDLDKFNDNKDIINKKMVDSTKSRTSQESQDSEINFGETSESNNSIIMCDFEEVMCPSAYIKRVGPNFYSGHFREMSIAQLTLPSPNKSIKDRFLRRNFHLLRKMRHPYIVLLMAVAVDNSQNINSLVCEPLKCSLYSYIYELGQQITIEEYFIYLKQLNEAVLYIHESGYVHSNICSSTVTLSAYNNCIKLSSFELAVNINYNMRSKLYEEEMKGTLFGKKMTDLPYKFLPYYVEYRKIFSQPFYQAPELVTARKKFVFPLRQSDVYGIALLLWEMLHKSIPFTCFSYDKMEKVFLLKRAQLLYSKSEKCQIFKSILENCLQINPEKRIQSVQELKDRLNQLEINVKINKNVKLSPRNQKSPDNEVKDAESDKSLEERDASSLSSKSFFSLPVEKTSTIKKRKKSTKLNSGAEEKFNDIEKGSLDKKFIANMGAAVSNTIAEKEITLLNHSRIEEVSSPSTSPYMPNKKDVQATNDVASERSLVQSTDIHKDNTSPAPRNAVTGNLNEPSTDTSVNSPSKKKFNVSIKVVQRKAINNHSPLSNISSQIKFWNSLSSQYEENSKSAEKSKFSPKLSDSTKTKCATNVTKCKDVEEDVKISEMPQNSTVKSVERNDVSKENEQFNNNNVVYICQNNCNPVTPKGLVNELDDILCEKAKNFVTDNFEKTLWRKEKAKCELRNLGNLRSQSVRETVSQFENLNLKKKYSFDANQLTEIKISKTNFEIQQQNENNMEPCSSLNIVETNESNVEEIGMVNISEVNTSRLDVVLKTKSTNQLERSISSNSLMSINSSIRELDAHTNMSSVGSHSALWQSPLFIALNFKSPQQRHFDANFLSPRNIRTYNDNEKLNRSICEIKIPQNFRNLTNRKEIATLKNKTVRLVCLNCGSKVFVVDATEGVLTNTSHEKHKEVNEDNVLEKSTEDIYIDDDYSQESQLGANMKLTTLSAVLDVLDFSSHLS